MPARTWGLAVAIACAGPAGVGAQICKSEDPESGGNIFPAIGHGTAVLCLTNTSDPLGLAYVRADDPSLPCMKEDADPSGYFGLYLFLLLWAFAGIGIIADIFMDAIAVITSTGRWLTRKNPNTGMDEHIYVKQWNPTVANLTLMALGSSAPEILLSVIEIIMGDFYSGELGPSTIVGSAAFNMLVILAVCTVAPPEEQVRKIADMHVFSITAFCSVFAYMWLLIILQWHGPDVVDLYEGIVSFLFFPMMVCMAFAADKGAFSPGKDDDAVGVGKAVITQVGIDSNNDGDVNEIVTFGLGQVGRQDSTSSLPPMVGGAPVRCLPPHGDIGHGMIVTVLVFAVCSLLCLFARS
eukprot:COSAG01_NODE_98_length_26629_cov_56.866453_19_plen_352_part_00